jgi:hypothetical protein
MENYGDGKRLAFFGKKVLTMHRLWRGEEIKNFGPCMFNFGPILKKIK